MALGSLHLAELFTRNSFAQLVLNASVQIALNQSRVDNMSLVLGLSLGSWILDIQSVKRNHVLLITFLLWKKGEREENDPAYL